MYTLEKYLHMYLNKIQLLQYISIILLHWIQNELYKSKIKVNEMYK